jgi:hypothetical protein
MFKIDKDIPLPVKDTTDGKSVSKRIIDTLKEMQVGDSFVIDEKAYTIYGIVKRFGVEGDKIYVARRIKETNKYRIFRTK